MSSRATSRALTVSVTIAARPDAVVAYVRDPRNLPAWAPGFARSVHHDGTTWVVQTADGPVGLAFAPDNGFGVVDHRVTGPGVDVTNPMRVLANGDHAEVLFTLFQAVGAADEDFERDVRLVQGDLRTLQRLLETHPEGP